LKRPSAGRIIFLFLNEFFSASEALVSGAAWASVCFSALNSPLALPSVSRLALQSPLPLL